MPTGSCLCGEIRIAYEGDPVFRAICYCYDDRKMANIQVFQALKSSFSVAKGKPKTYTKVSDHGHKITNHFCATCGTAMYRSGGAKINHDIIDVRAGVLDDQNILDDPPAIEVYVERRPPWVKKVEGAIQLNGKYEVVS
ncbi:hypothetical protein M434DRAFT_36167 [Hypoxylon sp. CO27-5]|nr:hypothetical protein M434DRAFT_36167 [Hypoxylon sp. CO27-5]